MPPCPQGWKTGPPDFVGVGTKKAGTTWWHGLITSHPEVHARQPAVPGHRPPRAKELHFFEVRWQDDFGPAEACEYHRYFPRPPGLRVGEWTPRYLVDCWTPYQLSVAAPEARLLLLVRDPIERFRSGMSHYLRRHGTLEHPRALVEEVEYGRYAAALDRLTRHFPRHQVLLLQYERCVRDTAAELERTYRFLGLGDTGFEPAALAGTAGQPARPKAEKVALGDRLRTDLRAEYEPDVRRLATEWPEVDLALWPHFADMAV